MRRWEVVCHCLPLGACQKGKEVQQSLPQVVCHHDSLYPTYAMRKKNISGSHTSSLAKFVPRSQLTAKLNSWMSSSEQEWTEINYFKAKCSCVYFYNLEIMNLHRLLHTSSDCSVTVICFRILLLEVESIGQRTQIWRQLFCSWRRTWLDSEEAALQNTSFCIILCTGNLTNSCNKS